MRTRMTVGRECGPRWLTTGSAVAFALVLLPLVGALQACDSSALVAPDGASIVLTLSRTKIGVDGDTTIVTAFLVESDGRTVDNGTQVTLLASGGQLCAPATSTAVLLSPTTSWCTATSTPGAITTETVNGVAAVIFRSGPVPGVITLTARSGAITQTATVELSALAAPAGTTIAWQADPDTLAVGDTSRITAFLASNAGPVADGTRVVFTSPDTAVQHTIVLTQGGFALTTVVAKKSGALKIAVTSGTIRDTVRMVVK